MPRRLAIQIRKKLTKEQYLKLFSNPVSGIACDMNGAAMNDFMTYCIMVNVLNNIRYSKSMILKALYFWEKQYDRYLELLKKAQFNPLFGSFDKNKENEILKMIMFVHNLPDTFLFSHRHIKVGNFKDNSDDTPCFLLKKKYPLLEKYPFYIQETKRDIFFNISTNLGIEFTVFPCEHPYIEKQKISKVGVTDKGNVYILHDRERNKK